MVRLLLALLVAAGLAVLYLFVALNWSYSTGERAGWVQKLSKKGWICKTWEGELALVSLPGSTVEKFHFTVHDDAVAARITRLVGKRVSLHYEEKVGLPTSCFGDTRHFVTDVAEAPDIPLAPGVSLPAQPAPAPAPASAPAAVPATVPASAAPPAAPGSATLPAPLAAPASAPLPVPATAAPAASR